MRSSVPNSRESNRCVPVKLDPCLTFLDRVPFSWCTSLAKLFYYLMYAFIILASNFVIKLTLLKIWENN